MTDGEWLACEDPALMLAFLQKASDRKLRFLVVEFSRRIIPLLSERRARRAVELAQLATEKEGLEREFAALERDLDDDALEVHPALEYVRSHTISIPSHAWPRSLAAAQLALAWNMAWPPGLGSVVLAQESSRLVAILSAWRTRIMNPHGVTDENAHEIKAKLDLEQSVHCDFIRDVFGNPFRPAAIDPAWLRWNDAAIPRIAQAIYDDRRFADLPVLADALEEAGCTSADILEHCRSGGEHVRGCWVVDLVLGKK